MPMDDSRDQNVDDIVSQLFELIERRRIDTAKSLLERSLPNNPDNVELLSCAVWVDYLEDDNEAARVTINRILAMDPKNFQARYISSLIYEEREEYVACEQQLLELMQDYPENATLYSIYSRLMLTTFHFEKAQKLASEALRIDPEDETALNVSVFCAYVNSPGEETEARLHQLMVEYPDQIQTTVRLIQVLNDRGETAQAYELSKQLVRLQPDDNEFVEMATALKVSSHWSMKPMWPMRRFGFGGSIALWFIMVIILRTGVLEYMGLSYLTLPIAITFIVYVVYSWVWPPILKRIFR